MRGFWRYKKIDKIQVKNSKFDIPEKKFEKKIENKEVKVEVKRHVE